MDVLLSEDVQRRLKEAASRNGVPPERLAGEFIEQALREPAKELSNGSDETRKRYESALAMVAEWDKEDETDDPAELERRRQEFEELKQALNANREATGERKLFP